MIVACEDRGEDDENLINPDVGMLTDLGR